MSKLINLKKLTANTVLGALIAGSIVMPQSTREAIAGRCDNNGHGNNGNITVTLESGDTVTISRFDPSNPGNSDYLTRRIQSADPSLTVTEIAEVISLIEAGSYDLELRGSRSDSSDCSTSSSYTNSEYTIVVGGTISSADDLTVSSEENGSVAIPSYSDLVTEEKEARGVNGNSGTNIDLDRNDFSDFPGNGTGDDPTVVKAKDGDLIIPDGATLTNYIIVVEDGGVTFSGTSTLNNVVIIAEGGGINLGSADVTDSAIMASGDMEMNNNTTFSGNSILASEANINFTGSTLTIEPYDELDIIATGGSSVVTYDASNDSRVVILSSNDIVLEEDTVLYGFVGAQDDISIGSGVSLISLADDSGTTEEETTDEVTTLTCPAGDTITLTGTLRDFSDTHPDFQYRISDDRGMVTTELGSDRKPVYAHPDGNTYTTNGKMYFDQWYRNVEGVNQNMEYSIELSRNPHGIYRFQDTSFFPINNQLMGNEGRSKNFHFTYELHSQFTYQGGETLNFSGDDDVWVYINGKRVIDLGGVHPRQDASVNIDDVAASLGLEVGQTYDFDFFFAERHTTQSNFILETSIELLCDTDNDGISDPVEGNSDTDNDGVPNYQDLDSDGNGIPDSEEGSDDLDGDNIPDFIDDDNDNNGYLDAEDGTDDTDGDGILNYQDLDDDNDGTDDATDTDTDGDGISNFDEDNPTIPVGFLFLNGGSADDIDGDGIVNSIDPDSDGNGVDDVDENSGDYDGDGNQDFPDNFTFPTGGSTDDVDGDGVPNSLDPNNDGDDLTDEEEEEYGSNPMLPDIYRD